MPFGGGKTQTLNVSGIAWDANLVVPAAFKITVDHVGETTGAHGIVADQVLTGAAGITGNLTQTANLVIPAAFKITVDHVGETTGGHGIVHDSPYGGLRAMAGNTYTAYSKAAAVANNTGSAVVHSVIVRPYWVHKLSKFRITFEVKNSQLGGLSIVMNYNGVADKIPVQGDIIVVGAPEAGWTYQGRVDQHNYPAVAADTYELHTFDMAAYINSPVYIIAFTNEAGTTTTLRNVVVTYDLDVPISESITSPWLGCH